MRRIAFYILALMLLAGCKKDPPVVSDPKPAVYYWRTTFMLDSAERQFLADYHVGKMFVRFFDVVTENGTLHPNATITFAQPVPEGIEIIPTVFLTEDCLRHNMPDLDALLTDRILQMCETNDIPQPREVQLDYDWTNSTREAYFQLLKKVRARLKKHDIRLSATIRLHQLSQPAPPIDEGVLMLYNTGDLADPYKANPILDYATVKPYLRFVNDYDLPLSVAYPNFSYNLHMRDGKLASLLYEANLADTTLFHMAKPGHYSVTAHREMPQYMGEESPGSHLHVGDSVIVVEAKAALVRKLHDELSKLRKGINNQVVIYNLDSKNINRFTPDDYEKIYQP